MVNYKFSTISSWHGIVANNRSVDVVFKVSGSYPVAYWWLGSLSSPGAVWMSCDGASLCWSGVLADNFYQRPALNH